MSISKNQIKIITSLSQKKYRIQHQLFIAEGVKVVNELLNSSLELEAIFATDDFKCDNFLDKKTTISESELQKISQRSWKFGNHHSFMRLVWSHTIGLF
jgi:RNA methyltransferase, TrmH family